MNDLDVKRGFIDNAGICNGRQWNCWHESFRRRQFQMRIVVPYVRISNSPAWVQIMVWRRSDDKPVSEPMMVSLLTHVFVIRPQWVHDDSSDDWWSASFLSGLGSYNIWIMRTYKQIGYTLRKHDQINLSFTNDVKKNIRSNHALDFADDISTSISMKTFES